jgi:hypothetical protein
VRRLRAREKYLGIKENAHELPYNTSALLPGKSKNPKKGLVNLSPLTRAIKEADRGEKEFKILDKKFKKRLEISPGLDSSIISSISNSKIF